jgi:hypothetical protein
MDWSDKAGNSEVIVISNFRTKKIPPLVWMRSYSLKCKLCDYMEWRSVATEKMI